MKSKVFEICGWNTCNPSYFSLNDYKPKTEYRLWISEITDRLSFILNKGACLV